MLNTRRCNTGNIAWRYRTLQVLQSKFNDVYRFPLAITQTLSLLIILRTIHGTITKEGVFQIHQLISSMTHLLNVSYMFKAMSQVNEGSRSVISAFKARRTDAWFRAFQRSCLDLRVQIGGLYYADRGMNLTMYSFIVEQSVNILISNR